MHLNSGLIIILIVPALLIYILLTLRPNIGLAALMFVIYTNLSDILISKFGLPSLRTTFNCPAHRGSPDTGLGVPGSLSRLDYPIYFDGGLYIAWFAVPFLCIRCKSGHCIFGCLSKRCDYWIGGYFLYSKRKIPSLGGLGIVGRRNLDGYDINLSGFYGNLYQTLRWIWASGKSFGKRLSSCWRVE